MLERSVIELIHAVLAEPDPERKLAMTEDLCRDARRIGRASWRGSLEGSIPRDARAAGVRGDDRDDEGRAGGNSPGAAFDGEDTASNRDPGPPPPRDPSPRPARPPHWTVLRPEEITDRGKLATARGRYCLMHTVAHIELSAVELALMTVADFPQEDAPYHHDWLRVAGEEVTHARLVWQRLRELGGDFGSEPVHLGLWETARAHLTLIERLGIVPRILEARGLDVSARLREQLRAAGDEESARILDRIYLDEIGHVQAGSRWFRAACARAGVDPERRFIELWGEFRRQRRGRPAPLDREGRLRAGFTEAELAAMSSDL